MNYKEKEKIRDGLRELPAYEKAYEKALKKRHNECDGEAIRAVCQHPSSTYYPDPSGNNADGYSCDICGVAV